MVWFWNMVFGSMIAKLGYESITLNDMDLERKWWTSFIWKSGSIKTKIVQLVINP